MLLTRILRRQRFFPTPLPLGRPLLRDRWSHIWWAVLLRASAAVLFGILTLAWPRHTALALVYLFGVYALIDGAGALVISARSRSVRARGWVTVAGTTSIAAGAFALSHPRHVAAIIISVIGIWLILRGGTEVVGEPALRRVSEEPAAIAGPPVAAARLEKPRDWTVVTNGVMSALWGAALIVTPKLGALALIWAIGAWAIIHGVLMLPFALRLKRDPAAAPG